MNPPVTAPSSLPASNPVAPPRVNPDEVVAFNLVRTTFDAAPAPLTLVMSQTFAADLADLISSSAPSNQDGGAPLRALSLQIKSILRSRDLI